MVELYCTPFVELIDRMRLEFKTQQSMFDLPVRKWYIPSAAALAGSMNVWFQGQSAGNPVGPASGPQSQMAQNLLLSWLAGSRIMELKTVQIKDDLAIPRPCIDATNVGYNVEWSQELKVHESLDQYVQGAMLIHMLREAPEAFEHPFGDVDLRGMAGDVIYDMSIGYDLAGIRSDKVRNFMAGMIDATESVQRLRQQIPPRLALLRDLDYPTDLSRSVTLSTFHGCPADEIEKICEFLLKDVGVDTIVKMNPPMLGKQPLEHLLHDVMDYADIKVHQAAYTNGLQFDESVGMTKRLTKLADSKGLHFGAKFSNTLEVQNHRDFFPRDEKVMYLSGAPLHVITLTLANEYRKSVGADVPISFSAGVDRKNFPLLVACGYTPITTCTDLLKTGGYGRLPAYLTVLEKDMDRFGATRIEDYVLDARNQRDASGNDPVVAGFLNNALIVEETQADSRYYQPKNKAIPRRIDSHLETFDCITCYKCIPVCPNDANFYYTVDAVDLCYRDLRIGPDGKIIEIGEEKRFCLERGEQIANFADYCNHCGNCDTFCPEYDGPYIMKPTFFGSRNAFEQGSPHDGFFAEKQFVGDAKGPVSMLAGRIGSQNYRLESADLDTFSDGVVTVTIEPKDDRVIATRRDWPSTPHEVDMGIYFMLRTLLRGIFDTQRVHPINTPWLADNEKHLSEGS